MPTDNSQFEIQTNSLIGLVPRIKELNNLLDTPIISDEFIQQYSSLAPQMRENWVKNNTNLDNVQKQIEQIEKINEVMYDLITDMSAIMGGTKVQNVMQTQQQQTLQGIKPNTQSTAPVESLE